MKQRSHSQNIHRGSITPRAITVHNSFLLSGASRGYFVEDGRRRVARVGLPVFAPNMWAMHLPRASRKPRSSFMVLVFSGGLFCGRHTGGEVDDQQLRPDRGNLYDDAFNRSIKNSPPTSVTEGDCSREKKPDTSADRNLYDYFREYIVVQRHRKYLGWTLRACFTSRRNENPDY